VDEVIDRRIQAVATEVTNVVEHRRKQSRVKLDLLERLIIMDKRAQERADKVRAARTVDRGLVTQILRGLEELGRDLNQVGVKGIRGEGDKVIGLALVGIADHEDGEQVHLILYGGPHLNRTVVVRCVHVLITFAIPLSHVITIITFIRIMIIVIRGITRCTDADVYIWLDFL